VGYTAQLGHNGGPSLDVEQMLALVGPKPQQEPAVFDCGAPWTGYAEDAELMRLGALQGRIERKQQSLSEDRKERTKIMMRCIRRMRRERGQE
jgi:hypothetical protein